MEPWQLDVVGGIRRADDGELKALTGSTATPWLTPDDRQIRMLTRIQSDDPMI